MPSVTKTVLKGILAALSIGFIFLAVNYLPVDLQAIISMILFMCLLEGLGYKAVADFQENTDTYMLFIPVVRYYKLGDVMTYAGKPLLGKLKLPFYSLVAAIISFAIYYLVSPGLVKAGFLILALILTIVHIICRTVYVFAITSELASTLTAILSLIVIIQPLIIFIVYRTKIKELKKYVVDDTDVEYEDEE